MGIFRCPLCELPLTEAESHLETCPACDGPLAVVAPVAPVVPVPETFSRGGHIRLGLMLSAIAVIAMVTGMLFTQRRAAATGDTPRDTLRANTATSTPKVQPVQPKAALPAPVTSTPAPVGADVEKPAWKPVRPKLLTAAPPPPTPVAPPTPKVAAADPLPVAGQKPRPVPAAPEMAPPPRVLAAKGDRNLDIALAEIEAFRLAALKNQPAVRFPQPKRMRQLGPGGAAVPGVHELTLRGKSITDQTVAQLAGMRGLQVLVLADTAVTGEGLERFPQLRRLDLSGAPVTDAGLARLAGLRNLRSLNLAETAVTGAGLGQLPALDYLNLNSTALTDQSLDQLRGLTRLRVLEITNTKVSDAAVDRLRQALPNVQISR